MTSLREHNRHRIIDVLRGAGAVSRAEIARRTGLSRSTVSSLVGELEDAGVVVEAANAVGVAHGTQGGRPPTLVSLDRSAGVAVGIDFGHGHLAVAVADLAHTVLAEARHDLGVDHEAAWGMRSAAELVGRLLAKAGVDRGQVLGVGMALPGPIDPISGTVGSSSILPGWIGVRAAEEMSRVLGMTVQVDNDANLGALAERAWGAGRDCATLAFIKVASGIGGGLIIDGRVHHGRSGAAGEIGHITVDEMGAVCRCGNRGCLETVAAAPAQLDLLRRAHGDGLTLDRLLALAAAGDPGCRRVIADAGRALGVAVAHVCNLLDPERVVVGGALSAAGELLLGPLRESARRCAISTAGEIAPIVPAELADRAELLGALGLVFFEPERFPAARLLAHAAGGGGPA